MTDMTENELARAWEPGQPRCMVEGCEEAPTATLFGKAGDGLGAVCAGHVHELGDPATFEPNTTLDWGSVRMRVVENDGWVFVRQVGELGARLYPPGSTYSNAVHGIIR